MLVHITDCAEYWMLLGREPVFCFVNVGLICAHVTWFYYTFVICWLCSILLAYWYCGFVKLLLNLSRSAILSGPFPKRVSSTQIEQWRPLKFWVFASTHFEYHFCGYLRYSIWELGTRSGNGPLSIFFFSFWVEHIFSVLRMVIIDIESNTSLSGLTLDPAGMHCPWWDDAFVSSY